MNIAIDAMGGNYAPVEVVKGAIDAAQQLDGRIILVGNEKELLKLFNQNNILSNIKIYHCPEVIHMHETPLKAIRQKRSASIRVAFELVKENKADAVVSAGNSGAFIASAILNLGLIKDIEKPALASIFPGKNGPVILIDSGANVDCKPSHLFQFGLLGHALAVSYLRVKEPKIGLLSIGEENNKGNKLVRTAHRIFQNSPLNFIGNVEGIDIFNGDVDVVVCDGFVGNVALKLCEGMAESITNWLIKEIKDHIIVNKIIKRLDYEEYGGGIVLGINGLGILCHGRSCSKAIKNAIIMAAQFIKNRLLENVVSELGNILNKNKGVNYQKIGTKHELPPQDT